MAKKEVILRIRAKVRVVPGAAITVGQVCELAGDAGLVETVKPLIVARAGGKRRGIMVLSALNVARVVQASVADAQVSLRGGDEVVILVEPPETPAGVFSLMKTALVALVLFLGSALAIINFHSEVSMAEAHSRLYWMITGVRVARPLVMQVPYSLGIGFGIALFFNHFRSLMGRDEPSPLEVEMYLYDRNVQECVASREEQSAGGERS